MQANHALRVNKYDFYVVDIDDKYLNIRVINWYKINVSYGERSLSAFVFKTKNK